MGRRGPKPTAKTELARRGSWRAKLHKPEIDVLEVTGPCPSCPGWLSDDARKEWDRLADGLYHAGILDGLSRGLFACYCCCWAHHVEAAAKLDEYGPVVKAGLATDREIPSVAFRAWTQAARNLSTTASMLGLSPASRAKLGIRLGQNDH